MTNKITKTATNIYGVPDSVDPSQYYNAGISAEAVCLPDMYNIDGAYWLRPYPLSIMGTDGALIAASNGNWFWTVTPDHPTGSANWLDGQDFFYGYSDDPILPPMALAGRMLYAAGANNSATNSWNTAPCKAYHLAFMVYAPEDTGNQFHFYHECSDATSGPGVTVTGTTHNGTAVITGIADTSNLGYAAKVTGTGIPASSTIKSVDSISQVTLNNECTADNTVSITFVNDQIQHQCGVTRSNDLVTYTFNGPANTSWGYNDFTSFQRPWRITSGDWMSLGSSYRGGSRVSGPPGDIVNGYGTWTSSDGLLFTRPDPPDATTLINSFIGTRSFLLGAWDLVTIAGQRYIAATEDARDIMFALSDGNPITCTKTTHGLSAGDPVVFNTSGTILTGNTTNGSAVVTNVAQASSWYGSIANLFDGCGIAGNGPVYTPQGAAIISGIPPGTTIININAGANEITLSTPVTATVIGNYIIAYTLPYPVMSGTTYYVHASNLTADTFEFSLTPNGAPITSTGATQFGKHVVPNGGMHAVRVAVDSNYNVLSSPAPVRIASYAGVWPGPQYIQGTNSCLVGGVMIYFIQRGFFESAENFGFITNSTYKNGGALQQQLYDIYTEVIDSVAAASNAPMGVIASCNVGVVTVSWQDCLPNNIYRVYRGTTKNTQATLIDDVTGVSVTDTPGSLGVFYYKVVTLNAGVEEGVRIVPVYASASGVFVNQHCLRVFNLGADMSTVDRSYLDKVAATLANLGLYNDLDRWVDPRCGVIQSGGVVTKCFDLGTTRLPRGQDIQFVTGSGGSQTTSTSTYSATGINGRPAIISANQNSYGVFGGVGPNGRHNPIRRKVGISCFARYSKPTTYESVLIGLGEFGGITLEHTAGAPGQASFGLYDDVRALSAVANVTGSATVSHSIGGTFGPSGNLYCFADGAVSAPTTGLHTNADLSLPTMLKGAQGGAGSQSVYLVAGSKNSKYQNNAWVMDDAMANHVIGTLALFTAETTPTQAQAVISFLTTEVVPSPFGITKNIETDFGAVGNGLVDDGPAFMAFNTWALAWQAANPGQQIILDLVTGHIYAFCHPGEGCYFVKGIASLIVNGNGATIQDKFYLTTTQACSSGGTTLHVASTTGLFGAQTLRDVTNPAALQLPTSGNGYTPTTISTVDSGTTITISPPALANIPIGETICFAGNGFFLGGLGIFSDNLHSATFATVVAGSTTVALTDPTMLSRFTVGGYVYTSGLDDMGYGYPPNPYYYELMQIEAIDANSASPTYGTITFTSPLTNSYKSTWPRYVSNPDMSGPATLFALDPTFNIDVEFDNMTIDGEGQIYGNGVHLKFNNVRFPNAPFIPTVNGKVEFDTVTIITSIEIDKMVGEFDVINSTLHALQFQSAVPTNFKMSNSTVASYCNGLPRKSTIDTTTFGNLMLGATGYGISQSAVIDDCVIGAITASGITWPVGAYNGVTLVNGMFGFPISPQFAVTADTTSGEILNFTSGTFFQAMIDAGGNCTVHNLTNPASIATNTRATAVTSGGVVTLNTPVASTVHVGDVIAFTWGTPPSWAVPGANAFFKGTYAYEGPAFTVTDVTSDDQFTYVHTTWNGGYPSFYGFNGSVAGANIISQCIADLTIMNCTGCQWAEDLSLLPAHTPFGSHWKRTITGNSGSTELMPVNGKLVSMAINVTRPYTGVKPTLPLDLSQFVLSPDLSSRTLLSPYSVDLKTAGLRTVTATAVTGTTGADVLGSVSGAIYLLSNQITTAWADLSAESPGVQPIVTVEIIVDQGLTVPVAATFSALRLWLHS